MGLLKPNTNQRIANSSKETSEATLKSFAVAGATFIDDNAQHTAGYMQYKELILQN